MVNGADVPSEEAIRVLLVEPHARQVRAQGAPLALTALEFDLLAFLMRHSRQAFTLTSVLALGVGALSAGRAMFISPHDLAALVVVLIAAGTIGALAALVLGHRVGAATRAMGFAARRIGEGSLDGLSHAGGTAQFPAVSQTQELSALARELEAMSAKLKEAQVRLPLPGSPGYPLGAGAPSGPPLGAAPA